MKVVLDGTAPGARMEQPADLQALDVELRDCSAAQAERLLAGLGRLDGDHVWLDVAALRQLSPLHGTGDWDAGFDATLRYAASRGWTSEAGDAVRAHIVGSG